MKSQSNINNNKNGGVVDLSSVGGDTASIEATILHRSKQAIANDSPQRAPKF